MTETVTPRSTAEGALLRYRVMAYVTGVVLIVATVFLILYRAAGVDSLKTANGLLWVTHGYLFLLYTATALQLGIKLRWPLVRLGLVIIAGTIPGLSFVAERKVTRLVRGPASATSGG